MWQEIVTFLIIIAAAVYTVVKFLKNLHNGGGDCGCGGGKNCRNKKR
ncbi:MAG: FeoB-associated Cys-rich membrane protein [Bacteroidales bacterium]|nr:FeoB-associated Cys-rich membrane protein [Bacteroidales bacterium]